MISSRNTSAFPAGASTTLTDARRAIKAKLEAAELFDQQLFKVWINEDAPAVAQEAWDECMTRVDRSDIVIVLFNGDAGWTNSAGDMGICHGEFQRAFSRTPAKVIVVQAGTNEEVAAHSRAPDRRFQDDIRRASRFRGQANTLASIVDEAEQAMVHALSDLVTAGLGDARRKQYFLGDALEWAKLDFRGRESRICDVLESALEQGGGVRCGPRLLAQKLAGHTILFRISAVPGAMSVSAAREIVGRPFLKDHEHLANLTSAAGPVHLIGCSRVPTETQATNLLGFPDAIIVSAPFGVYVADDIQKIQFVLLANCRDESLTRLAIQRFLAWLDQSQEGALLAGRARSRQRIVNAIAGELGLATSGKSAKPPRFPKSHPDLL